MSLRISVESGEGSGNTSLMIEPSRKIMPETGVSTGRPLLSHVQSPVGVFLTNFSYQDQWTNKGTILNKVVTMPVGEGGDPASSVAHESELNFDTVNNKELSSCCVAVVELLRGFQDCFSASKEDFGPWLNYIETRGGIPNFA